ncbi:MAG: chemotaxis protein CheD [Gracilibacteraceae bacterium]|jgi:chemotaxis protein CheD|nr:chemotaxis protein CheD [Gracilibacteraceae bacterium]
MEKAIIVGISDLAAAKAPAVVATYALGSCVGICLFDNIVHVGGLSHILLPKRNNNDNLMKFADSAIPLLVQKLEQMGAHRLRLRAKIAGGAQMFNVGKTDSALGNIGQRNVESVKTALQAEKIRIFAEDTGKDFGRSIFFNVETGALQIKTAFNKIYDI